MVVSKNSYTHSTVHYSVQQPGSQSVDLLSAESANKFSSCPTWWCQRTSCSSFNKTRLSDSTEMPIIYSIVGLHRTEMQSKQGSIKRYNMDVESHTKFWWQNNTIGFQRSLLNFSQLTLGPDLQLIVPIWPISSIG